jgi:hypothetical protein
MFHAPFDQLRVLVDSMKVHIAELPPVPKDSAAPATEIQHRSEVLRTEGISPKNGFNRFNPLDTVPVEPVNIKLPGD